jgi:hypothetical protein
MEKNFENYMTTFTSESNVKTEYDSNRVWSVHCKLPSYVLTCYMTCHTLLGTILLLDVVMFGIAVSLFWRRLTEKDSYLVNFCVKILFITLGSSFSHLDVCVCVCVKDFTTNIFYEFTHWFNLNLCWIACKVTAVKLGGNVLNMNQNNIQISSYFIQM